MESSTCASLHACRAGAGRRPRACAALAGRWARPACPWQQQCIKASKPHLCSLLASAWSAVRSSSGCRCAHMVNAHRGAVWRGSPIPADRIAEHSNGRSCMLRCGIVHPLCLVPATQVTQPKTAAHMLSLSSELVPSAAPAEQSHGWPVLGHICYQHDRPHQRQQGAS
jgi:hypothetical protein